MTRAARQVGAVTLILFLLSSPVHAIIPDPVEASLLAKITAALQAIQELRMKVLDKLQEQIYNRLRGYAFPSLLFGQIRTATASVVDIRRDLQRLGCGWEMSPRTLGLQEALLKRLQFCRSDHQDIWGSHERFWDGPIQEMNDYVAVMTTNMISERVQKTNTSWVRAHLDVFDGHATVRDSPGEANRAEAAALAWANEVAVGNSQIVTQNLLVRQMARDLERFDEKKAADLSHYTYRGLATLAGGDWRDVPEDLEAVDR